jgi:hypothetical protein
MRYFRLLIFSVLCLFAVNPASAQSYAVDVPVLNVRSCAGTQCSIVGKLNKGELVFAEEDIGEWVKVQTEKGEGFVVKRSLRADVGGINPVWIVVLLILAVLFWFLPSLVASNNKNYRKIFWINLLLGWFPIIWLILLFAALVGDTKEKE